MGLCLIFPDPPSSRLYPWWVLIQATRGSAGSPLRVRVLLAQTELFDKSAVTLDVFLLQVIQNVTTATNQLEQAGA